MGKGHIKRLRIPTEETKERGELVILLSVTKKIKSMETREERAEPDLYAFENNCIFYGLDFLHLYLYMTLVKNIKEKICSCYS